MRVEPRGGDSSRVYQNHICIAACMDVEADRRPIGARTCRERVACKLQGKTALIPCSFQVSSEVLVLGKSGQIGMNPKIGRFQTCRFRKVLAREKARFSNDPVVTPQAICIDRYCRSINANPGGEFKVQSGSLQLDFI